MTSFGMESDILFLNLGLLIAFILSDFIEVEINELPLDNLLLKVLLEEWNVINQSIGFQAEFYD